MEVADQNRARGALTFLGALFLVEAGALAFSAVLPQLVMRYYSFSSAEVLFKGISLMWFGLTCALAFAAWNLSQSVKGTELVWVLLGAVGLTLCLELYFLVVESFMPNGEEPGSARTVLSVVSIAASLAMILSMVTLIGRLGRSTAFAVGIGVFAVLRSFVSVVLVLRIDDERPPVWAYPLRTFAAVGVAVAVAVLALKARNVGSGGTNVLTAPVAQQPIMEASGMRLIVTGVALLVLGIGGTALSFSVASSGSGGGRYVIATGAIATGLVQLVRGLSRLGKGS